MGGLVRNLNLSWQFCFCHTKSSLPTPLYVVPGGVHRVQGKTLLKNMYAMFIERDCTLVEINPLAETPEGRGMRATERGY